MLHKNKKLDNITRQKIKEINKEYNLEENEIIENLEVLEYLFNQKYIDIEEYQVGLEIRKAFRKQRSLSCGINYEKLLVDGGKQDPNWEIIFESNRNWEKIENLIKKDKLLIENTICIEITKKQLTDKVGEYILFDKVFPRLILTLEKLTRLKNNDYDNLINLLNKKVKEFGFNKTCKVCKINKYSLNKILKGDKDYKFSFLEKLKKFFNI